MPRRRASRRPPKMARRVDKLYWELEARVKDWTGGLEDAEKTARKFAAFIGKHPVAAVGALTAALVALDAKATKLAADLEHSLSKTASIIDRMPQDMEGFRRGVLGLFSSLPVDNIDDLT